MNENRKNNEKLTDIKYGLGFDFSYVGSRLREIRKAVGETRENLSNVLGVSVTKYGLIETKSSCSLSRFIALINYLADQHNISACWIVIQDNCNIPMFLNENRNLAFLIKTINEQIKEDGLMVSLVPKV